MKKLSLFVIFLLLTAILCSCTGYQIKYIYPDGDNYTFGVTTLDSGKVRNIEIDWLAGSVNIKYSNTNVIDIYEPDEEKYASEQCLHWWLDSDTLRIHFSASLMIEPFIHQKDLIITLPEGFDLSKLRINTTSADILCNYLKADTVFLTATSGDMDIDCQNTPEKLNISDVSGDVLLKLPEDAGFTAKIETTSGTFTSDIPFQMNGEKYEAGDKSSVFDIETTSGNVKITK